jgi:hypothetical protein
MRSILFIFLLAILSSCSQPFEGKYKVGQHVEILTGDKYTIMDKYNGVMNNKGEVIWEPEYKLMTKAGWNISWDLGTGAQLSRGIFYAKESQIIGEVPK